MSYFRRILYVLIITQLYQSFSPPKSNMDWTDTPTSFVEVMSNIGRYERKPVLFQKLSVSSPTYLYIGGIYWIKDQASEKFLLVLCRKYPPKSGSIIDVIGVVKPIISIGNFQINCFKQSDFKIHHIENYRNTRHRSSTLNPD